MVQRPSEFPSDLNAPPSGGRTPYVALWAVMASFAALYLIAVSVRPAFLDAYLPVANAQLVESANRTDAEIADIRDTVGQLRSDVTKIQSDETAQVGRERALADRVAALEQRAAPTEAQPEVHSEARPSERAAESARVLNAQELETGSVESGAPAAAKPKPAAEKAAAVAPAPPKPKPVGIKLATGASVDQLRTSWSILNERHANELSTLQPRYSAGAEPETVELVAGPIKSTADAKKLCKELQAQAIACSVVGSFGGKPL